MCSGYLRRSSKLRRALKATYVTISRNAARAHKILTSNRTMQREAASRACGKRGVLCTVYVSSPLHWPIGLWDKLFKRVDHLGRCARRVRIIASCV